MPRLRPLAVIIAVVTLLAAAACSRAEPDRSEPAAPVDGGVATEVRLGYFPNVTHAPAIVAVEQGLFTAELGSTTLTPQTFNAGGDAVNALLGGSLDITYIGSGPAINAFAKSEGAVRLVAGATEGGAQLVVKPEITSPEQLRGRTIATPQLGNTQDIALKKWLAANGLTVGDGPQDVKIANLDNPRTLDAFREGSVDGGWLPEPWSSRLVLDAGASVLLDERTLWPNGLFPTTVVLVRAEFLQQYPETVRAVLRAHLKAIDLAESDPAAPPQPVAVTDTAAPARFAETATVKTWTNAARHKISPDTVIGSVVAVLPSHAPEPPQPMKRCPAAAVAVSEIDAPRWRRPVQPSAAQVSADEATVPPIPAAIVTS